MYLCMYIVVKEDPFSAHIIQRNTNVYKSVLFLYFISSLRTSSRIGEKGREGHNRNRRQRGIVKTS